MIISVIHKENNNTVSEEKDITKKKVFVFDIDGTLTASKSDMTEDMAGALCLLLKKRRGAFLAGGTYEQVRLQCADKLTCKEELRNLLLVPTSGGAMYSRSDDEWETEYKLVFTDEEKKSIKDAFQKSFVDIGYTHPSKVWGEVIEDRDSQITFSAVGQKAPVEAKEKWNKESDIRSRLKDALLMYLPGYIVRMGGLTSVDVMKADKAYGLEQITKFFQYDIKDAVFFGDKLDEGGNDYDVLTTGVDAVRVTDYLETRDILLQVTKEMREG